MYAIDDAARPADAPSPMAGATALDAVDTVDALQALDTADIHAPGATIERVRAILDGIFPGRRVRSDRRALRDLGLDSLSAARLVVELQLAFGVQIPMARLGECRGAAELAEWIEREPTAGAAGAAAGPAPSRTAQVRPDPRSRHEPFPLTTLQQAYLIGRDPDLSPDPVGCRIYREFEFDEVDPQRLRASWQRLVERHEALRLVVTADGRQQVLAQAPTWPLPVHQLSGAQARAAAQIEEVRDRLSRRAYEPGQWPPFAIEVSRRDDGPSLVHLSVEAMITDGRGLDLLLEQWWQEYADADAEPVSGSDADLPLRDCVLALNRQAGGPAYREDLDYWSGRLAGLPPGPDVLTGSVARPAASLGGVGDPANAEGTVGLDAAPPRRRPLSASLDAAQWTALRRRAAEAGTTPTAFLLTLFADTFARHGAHEPFSLVLTTNQRGRLPAAAAHVVGPFTSTCVFVVDEVRDRALDEAAAHLGRRLWEDLDHGVVGGVDALRELRVRGVSLPVVFTSLLDESRPAPRGGFASAASYAVSQTSGIAIDAQVWQLGDELRLRWDVSEAVAQDVAQVLFCDFVNALVTACAAAASREARRPLNELQKAYYVAAASGDTTGCQVYHSFDVDGLDVDRLSAAWARMIAEYEALRSYVAADGSVRVLDAAPPSWRVPVIEYPDPDEAARLGDRLVSRPFPLGRWPRFDLRVTRTGGSTVSRVHLTIDLIVCDGRSVHFLMRELLRLCADSTARPRPALSYEEFAAQARQLSASPRYPEWSAHWRRRLAELPPGPALPMQGAVGGERRRVRREAVIPGWPALRERAARAGAGPDALLVAALGEALCEVFDGPFALPVVRWSERMRDYRPGEYTALSWIAHDPGAALLDRAAACQRLIDADEAAGAVDGLAELRRVVMKQRRTGRFGYPVVYTGLLELAEQPLPEGVTAGPWLTCTPDVSMDCIAMDCGDGELRCFWDVVDADFAPGAADRVFGRYLSILRGAAASAASAATGTRVSAGPAEQTAEAAASRHRILVEWNDTERPFAADGPIHLAFENQVRLRPEAVALRWRGGGTTTFRELNRRANAIARRLRGLGIGAGSVVGICARRGPDLVASVYGVLKAGGAYLPIEPYVPARRALGILTEAGAVALLTTEGALSWSPPPGVAVVRADAEPALALADGADLDQNPEIVNGVDDPAYIIYTSGSTGKPKGVLVTHRPLHNLFAWCRRMFGFDSSDVGLCVTSLGFDLSVFDLLGLLGFGAGLYLTDEAEQKDPALLLDALLAEPITFWNSAPTTLAQLAPFFPDAAAPGTGDLRLVFLSGDYTPLSLPARLRESFPNSRLVSLGGATEATVWSNYFPVETVDPQWRSIPYGWPIDNCRYYVLDERLEPCPPGEPGDLFIAGSCLSRGYVGQPELTRERFIPDPHAAVPGESMYRTGDRASYFPDGTICFLGRLDDQVKIRGFRVELGEIEHRLRQHPAVADVVVMARPDPSGDRKLVAYVVPASGAAGPTAKQLRQHAAVTLPDYMVPNHVGFLDGFPATANGKLNRDALPWPLRPAAETARDPEPEAEPAPEPAPEPVTVPAPQPAARSTAPALDVHTLVGELGALFAELLGAEQVDTGADLWDQGATSFTMVQASAALQKRHGRRIAVSTLLAEPTVEGIARAVAAELGGRETARITAAAAPGHADLAVPPAAPDPSPSAIPAQPPASAPVAPAAVSPGGLAGGAASAKPHGGLDFFDPAARAKFKQQSWNLRPKDDSAPTVALPGERAAAQFYRWRASRREFTAAPVPLADLGRLLSLLRPIPDEDGDRDRYLYPSAGDTYAVQVYVHVFGDRVTGLAPGVYYYRPQEHTLQLVNPEPRGGRSAHFYYNREIYDRAAFQLYLVGQSHAIEPLYGDDGARFLALESGYLAQLLMTGQAACGLGLCPIGAVAEATVRADLDLDDGHRFMQAFLGGRALHERRTPGGEAPPYAPTGRCDVAVIGMAGRYPGADDLDELWRNLRAGRTALGPLPADRTALLRAADGVDADTVGRAGGFLPASQSFDSLLFGIAPHEAATLDPQLGLLLEAVWRCFEDAGYTPQALHGLGRTGVFVAAMWPDHHLSGADAWRAGSPAAVSGIAADLPNRVSHAFGFTGPSIAVNTSCSSSLTALHLAVRSIENGECDTAVVAGVNLISHPYHLALLTGLGLVGGAADGTGADGAAFAADASGWFPAEGAGALLLRPRAAAAAERDVIHGVIEATWVGHAGTTSRFGAPDARSLADSLGRALSRAALTPRDIDYVECAAAGAAIADAAELEALGRVFAERGAPVAFGTVKPNLGHLEAAAGISQLAKVLLQLRHRSLAPTVAAARRNPLADWDPRALRLVERPEPWPRPWQGPGRDAGSPPRALVNALGATGSYAHVVVRSASGGED